MSEWQLRDFRIAAGHLDEFVAAWTAGVLPLRRRLGFEVRAFSIPEQDRFVWIVGWHGPGSFEEADRRYYATPERAAISPDPAQWIVENRTSPLTPVGAQEDAP